MIALAFLRRYWQAALIVALAGVVFMACHERDNALRAEGAAKEKLSQLAAKWHVDSLTAHTRDSVVRVDTLRYVRWQTKFDTAVRTLHLTDTISVKEFVTVADSTVKACRASITTLALSCAAKDTLIATQRAMLAIRTKPSVFARRQLSVGIAGGYGAVLNGKQVTTGPALTVGVTWTPF